jgi:cysteinyl-tRNA synthetase
MSKSLGNNILPNEIFYSGSPLLSKTFSESAVKFFMLQAHYRSVLDISNEALLASEKGFTKILDAINVLEKLDKHDDQTDFDIQKWSERCYEAMNDDFNTPILIANLFDAVKFINQLNNGKGKISNLDSNKLLQILNSFVFEILGLEKNVESKKVNDKTNDVLEILIKLRDEARINKNYELSDKIRDMLNSKGIVINDSDTNSSFSIN